MKSENKPPTVGGEDDVMNIVSANSAESFRRGRLGVALLRPVIPVGLDELSLLELKVIAKNLLPARSVLRSLILSEPDYLPKNEAMAKVDIFIKLLYQELDSR